MHSSAVASNSEVPRSSSSSTPQSSSKSSFAKQLSQNRLIQNGIKQPEKGIYKYLVIVVFFLFNFTPIHTYNAQNLHNCFSFSFLPGC